VGIELKVLWNRPGSRRSIKSLAPNLFPIPHPAVAQARAQPLLAWPLLKKRGSTFARSRLAIGKARMTSCAQYRPFFVAGLWF
jgi:hypothetical protein